MLQQNFTVVIFIIVLGLGMWYIYAKLHESERAYYTLYQRSQQLFNENQILRTRVKDLHSYKNDVSKTFKILDNELMLINDHIKKQVTHQDEQLPQSDSSVSLLTPELLNSFFTNAFEGIYPLEPNADTDVAQDVPQDSPQDVAQDSPQDTPQDTPQLFRTTVKYDFGLGVGGDEYEQFLLSK